MIKFPFLYISHERHSQVLPMLSNEFLQSISAKAAKIFPAASAMQEEIEGKLFKLLQSSFTKLNLVTREEFDSQLAVLQRAEATIDKLEQRIIELEKPS
jgi:ubiquinone biosynthesis accessory factor UbiK